MSRGLNKIQIIGNLGRDPDVHYTQTGKCVANLSVAVNEQWNDRNGQRQEKTEWVRCVLWDKLGEIAKEYLRKGAAVYLEGRLQTRSWDDKDGQKRYTTEVNVFQMLMLGNGRGGGSQRVDELTHPDDEQGQPRVEPPVDETDDVPF